MAKATTKPKRTTPSGSPGTKAKPAKAKSAATSARAKAPKPKAASSARGKAPAAPAKPVPGRTTKVAAPTRIKRTIFDAKTLASIKKGLIEEHQDLLEQLGEIEEAAFSPEQTEAAGEAGYDDDGADAGTATFEKEKDLSIANNIQDLIDKINKALNKIDEGTYGICESCGQPISADRLKALPHVLLCIKCKKAEERR